MQKSKTHFDRISVAVVKKIVGEFHDDVAGNRNAVRRTSPSQVEVTSQTKEGGSNNATPEVVNQLLTAKTDEVEQAVHDECLLKVGI
jgi:hypothetical protein